MFHLLKRLSLKAKTIVLCVTVGYILCVSAMMFQHSLQQADFNNRLSHPEQTDYLKGAQRNALHRQDSPPLAQVSSENRTRHRAKMIAKPGIPQSSVSKLLFVPNSPQVPRHPPPESFTVYQFDDSDSAVNTLAKPHIRKERRRQKKPGRRRSHLTPPIVTNLDGNPVTGHMVVQ